MYIHMFRENDIRSARRQIMHYHSEQASYWSLTNVVSENIPWEKVMGERRTRNKSQNMFLNFVLKHNMEVFCSIV